MEDSNNYGHQHPLVLLNEEQLISNQSRASADCSRCEEKVSAPCFGCAEGCGFYLHKVCAEAPSELNHPFHHNHPLLLMQNAPYIYKSYICNFCDKTGEKFVYHCSCELDLHIKCALLTFNISQNNLKELQHVALQPPMIPTKRDDELLEDVTMCFGCWEPLANYTYFSPDSGFNLHKKCSELPIELNHMCHRKHALVLQFNEKELTCKICQVTPHRGLVYGCSPCEFIVHIECLSPCLAPVIESMHHEHPFRLFPRQAPFICDACGTGGAYSAYICCTCNIIVHKRCTLLPHIIKSKWHDHCIFHKYFLLDDFRSSDCIICHKEIDPEHGSYCCSYCNVTFHVNCVTEDKHSYFIFPLEYEISDESSITVLERNDAGEATKIKHFMHDHNLTLVGGYENSCDGCMLPISDSCYHCSECGFCLHKGCAELPRKKHVWHHSCRKPLVLISNKVFKCEECSLLCNAFAYECCECPEKICLRCVITLTPGVQKCSRHEHPLFFYRNYKGRCNACGDTTWGAFRCKEDDFVLDHHCFSLPITAHHKCDEHLLSLTDHDDNSYSESHFCDICEKSRDPNNWFYHCATCDTSAHVNCVLGDYPFIKVGSIYKVEHHPHPLTFVKKSYYYPDCNECGVPCEGLALECTECNYIIHWDCVDLNLSFLRFMPQLFGANHT